VLAGGAVLVAVLTLVRVAVLVAVIVGVTVGTITGVPEMFVTFWKLHFDAVAGKASLTLLQPPAFCRQLTTVLKSAFPSLLVSSHTTVMDGRFRKLVPSVLRMSPHASPSAL
jgi:hypothetical protein